MAVSRWQEARSALEEGLSPVEGRVEAALHQAAGGVAAEALEGAEGRILKEGEALDPGRILLLVRHGVSRVRLRRRPQAQVLGPKGTGAPLVSAVSAWLQALGLEPALPLQAEQEEVLRRAAAFDGKEADLLVLAGGERPEPPQGSRIFFSRLDAEPGREGAAWRNPAGGAVLYLPGDPLGAFTVLHLAALPGLRRLCGASGPFPVRRSPLRFSKVWPKEETRIYPGRLRVEGGEALVEHLAEDRPDLAGLDCLFEVPAGEWIRDGDPVRWVSIRGEA